MSLMGLKSAPRHSCPQKCHTPRLPWTANREGTGRAEGMILLALANMSHDLRTLSLLALPRSRVP